MSADGFRRLLGAALGEEDLDAVEALEPSFAAEWARQSPAWLLFGCAALVALAVLYYARSRRRTRVRPFLVGARALVLVLVFLMLAEPVITVHLVRRPRPLLWLLVDGTASMAIEDAPGAASAGPRARVDGLRDLFRARPEDTGPLLESLGERFRLRAYVLDRSDGVRPVGLDGSRAAESSGELLAAQLTADGAVTALGAAFRDLARRHGTSNVAGLLVFSDFNQNAGPDPLESATRLGVPVYTVGVGPAVTVDLSVQLRAPPVLKKNERSSVVAVLRQSGLEGSVASVRVEVERASGSEGVQDGAGAVVIGERDVSLAGPSSEVDFAYTPDLRGTFTVRVTAKVEGDDTILENNTAERRVNVRDDFLRLLFVEYEPTWEWRFLKEVFHRDPLVGMRGFRTFLRSSDPKVRSTNALFLPTLTLPRREFFAYDVIFLGDVPASLITSRFAEMTREFVDRFGGGLVILSGPRFGPDALSDTLLEPMLPVVVDPGRRMRDGGEFTLERTTAAGAFDFMRLGETQLEERRAWANLSALSWYQPVSRPHPLATVLAEHPTDTCADGSTRQPLMAIRRYGRGEVVYMAFNETWRLRRKHGERYYRQFWGQLMHRLGLSHALGAEKRFVVGTDRDRYRVDENVILTVEGYDEDFRPLGGAEGVGRQLEAELVIPPSAGAGPTTRPLSVHRLTEGVFETRFQVLTPGEHRVLVKDPITGESVQAAFHVTSVSVERRGATRNAALAEELAHRTGGRSYDLESVWRFPDEVRLPRTKESVVRVIPVWNSWTMFILVGVLLAGEWCVRKLVRLE